MSEPWFALLRCPATGQPLAPAPASLIEALEARRLAGTLALPAAQLQIDPVEPIRAALLREDGAVCYLVIDGTPILLPDHAVPSRID